MRYGGSARVLEARGDAGDGEEEQASGAFDLGIVEGLVGAQGAEGPELEVAERVDVRVAQLDRPPQHAAAFEQPRLAEHPEHPLLGQRVLLEHERREVRAVAELEIAPEDAP